MRPKEIKNKEQKDKNKIKKLTLISMLLLVATTRINAQKTEFPKLTGPYLGQTPPVNEPVLFAPGIVSNGNNAGSVAISPDGKEIYWDVGYKIWFTKLENGRWTKPEIVSFCKGDSHMYRVPFITPDGKKMFFISTRSGAVSHDMENIWYAERTSGWSDPKPISADVNEMPLHWSISVSNSGTLYFGGNFNIYYSKLADGVHTKPVRIGLEINTPATETCPHIAPDESYIIFCRDNRRFDKDGNIIDGDRKLMISFRDRDGNWRSPLEMGADFYNARFPSVSPDGKYLFFHEIHTGLS